MKTKQVCFALCILLALVFLLPLLSGCEAEERFTIDDLKHDLLPPDVRFGVDGQFFAIGPSQEELEEKAMRELEDERLREAWLEELEQQGMSRKEAEAYVAEAQRDPELEKQFEKMTLKINLDFFLRKVQGEFEEDVDRRVREGVSREAAEKEIDIRNKMLEVVIYLIKAYEGILDPAEAPGPGMPGVEMETWMEFLDGTWRSESFSIEKAEDSKRTYTASPDCNLREVVSGWLSGGIGGGVDPGSGNLAFSATVEVVRTRDNGEKYSEYVRETVTIAYVDDDHVVMTGRRHQGNTTETFRRIG